MNKQNTEGTHDLLQIANQAMLDRGLEPEFSQAALEELVTISTRAVEKNQNLADLTELIWCSIDNDDSMDLDQITTSESLPSGNIKILVAVADVDAVVKMGYPIDQHAQKNYNFYLHGSSALSNATREALY